MKILHLITTIELGGAEKQLLILAREQAQLGHSVDVAFLKGTPQLATSFSESGITIIESLRNYSILRQILELRKLLSRDKYEVVHSHLPRAELLFAVASFLFRFSGVSVSSKHNAEPFSPKFPRFLSWILSRLASNASDAHIFISKAVADFCLSSGEISKRKSSVIIFYAFDKSLAKHNARKKVKDQSLKFLFFGRFEPQKNIFFLIESFKSHRKIFQEDTLTLVGSGSHELDVRKESCSGIFVKDKTREVDVLLKSHDCLVLPSLYEGFGLVLLEAMAFGLPILCSNISAMPEVLGKNYEGFFDPKDMETLLGQMSRIQDPAYYSSLSRYCRSRIDFFPIEKTANQTLALYSRLSLLNQ